MRPSQSSLGWQWPRGGGPGGGVMVSETEGQTRERASVINRREALKKGAIAGGAVLWVTPAVQSIGLSRALAQPASPRRVQSISNIQFRFQCGTTTYYAHVDSLGSANRCQAGAGNNPCVSPEAGDQNGCGRFTLNVVRQGNEVSQVTVTLNSGCTFLEGASKCGGSCHPAVGAGQTATFGACPAT